MKEKQGLIIHQDVAISVILLLAGLYLYSAAGSMMESAARFPKLMLIAFFFFIANVLIQGIRKSIAATRAGDPAGTKLLTWSTGKYPYAVFLISAGYVALMPLIGFFPATALYCPALMLFFKCRQWLRISLLTAGTVFFVYIIFVVILKANLP